MKKLVATFGKIVIGVTIYFMKKLPILLHFSTNSLALSIVAFVVGLSNSNCTMYFEFISETKMQVNFYIFNWSKFNLLSVINSSTLLKNKNNFFVMRIVLAKHKKPPVHTVTEKIDSIYSCALLGIRMRYIHSEILNNKIIARALKTLRLNRSSFGLKPIHLKHFCTFRSVCIVI